MVVQIPLNTDIRHLYLLQNHHLQEFSKSGMGERYITQAFQRAVSLKKRKKKCKQVGVLPTLSLCVHVPGVYRGQERATDPLEWL